MTLSRSLTVKADQDTFHRWSLLGIYWARKYRSPASKWFGRIAWRIYFRKWWVPDAVNP